jgi:cytochrome c peroxidase
MDKPHCYSRRLPLHPFWKALILLMGLALAGAAQQIDQTLEKSVVSQEPKAAVKAEPIKPIPLSLKLDSRKVALGEKLFREPVLSHDNTISCSSCHSLAKGGTDRLMRSVGLGQREGNINSPTVFNSGFNFKQFWDGRANTLEDQIDGPIQATNEMGSVWREVVQKLQTTAQYAAEFSVIYSDGVQPKNVKDAIAEYERSLTTPNSRFDKYLRGDDAALTQAEKDGYHKFKAFGCVSCHQGVNIGGNMFETFGTMGDYFAVRGNITKADLGRFNITGREQDRFVFKVPSLRNVALTAPYFHDGSAKTLEEAVGIMAQYQVGRSLSPQDAADLVLFLKTLTGEYGGKPL